MKWFVNIAVASVAFSAPAFDSEAWLLKRGEVFRAASSLKARYAECAAKVSEPAENVMIPVESHPDGSVKSSVFAKKAQLFLESGLVWGEGVVVRDFREDGTQVSRVDAENCVVDRNAKAGWAQGKVKAVYNGTTLEGEGVYLSFAREFVLITDKAKISSMDFDVDRRGKESGKDKVLTTLTSRRADYDRQQGVVMFEDGVTLDNPEYKFASDSLFAFLSGTNELKRVVAIGNVSVADASNRGTCDRAVFVRSKSRVTMYAGQDGTPARLVDTGRRGDGRNSLEGEKISFWLDSEQVEVENSRISVDPGGKLKL